eukprot:scaffold36955_cov33-Tisochrysis_lutea.AAC.2
MSRNERRKVATNVVEDQAGLQLCNQCDSPRSHPSERSARAMPLCREKAASIHPVILPPLLPEAKGRLRRRCTARAVVQRARTLMAHKLVGHRQPSRQNQKASRARRLSRPVVHPATHPRKKRAPGPQIQLEIAGRWARSRRGAAISWGHPGTWGAGKEHGAAAAHTSGDLGEDLDKRIGRSRDTTRTHRPK